MDARARWPLTTPNRARDYTAIAGLVMACTARLCRLIMLGIVADNSYITGTALSIHQGGIQVQGAGLNSNTAVFTHRVLSSTIVAGFASVITNPLTDNQPNAILI